VPGQGDDDNRSRVSRRYSEATADDLIHQALEALVDHGESTDPSRGSARELRGVTLELTNPLARLSRSEMRGKIFSCLAELCWYLSGSGAVEPIEHYLPVYRENAEADGTVHGAYGPRLFAFDGLNQVQTVIDILRERPFSRRAVIQLFDHGDLIGHYADVPCTCTLQYFVRGGCLDAVTFMRSNDAYRGLPHDVFSFTMLQELVARSLDVELGTYIHMVGSLHLYNSDFERTNAFLTEGWQSTTAMPPMPNGDPWSSVDRLVAAEQALRLSSVALSLTVDDELEPYWSDLVRLLSIFDASKKGDTAAIKDLRGQMNSPVFEVFIVDSLRRLGEPS
jgi:thymidylate synthase